MSFEIAAHLKGAMKNTRPLKCCDKCGKPSEVAGGVQLSASRWSCFKCWQKMMSGK